MFGFLVQSFFVALQLFCTWNFHTKACVCNSSERLILFFYFVFFNRFLLLELQLFWTEINMLNSDRVLHPVSYFQLNSIF